MYVSNLHEFAFLCFCVFRGIGGILYTFLRFVWLRFIRYGEVLEMHLVCGGWWGRSGDSKGDAIVCVDVIS